MSKPTIAFVFLLLVCSSVAAQKIFTKEITVITDNDNYDLDLSDRYYSNGFIVNFNWAAKKTRASVAKKINRAELAHKVFNPYKINRSLEEVLANMDRPFAGWLYGSFGVTSVSKKNHVLLYTGTLGIMGPAALGKQIQQGWHKFIGLYRVFGWDYQLKNEPGINISAEYYHSLLKPTQQNISLHIASKATIGNTFTNALAGVLFKAGWLNTEAESGFWSGNLAANTKSFKKNEFIFFIEPAVQLNAYNATLEGGLFRKDKGVFTTKINPLVFQTRTGIMITGNKAGLRWYYTFRSSEGKQMKTDEHWGSIGISLRF
jgi:lipid A 3-O-deacylase